MKNLLRKLQQVQNELKATKDCFNKFGKYNYRNAEKLLTDIKPLLDKYNMVMVLKEDIVSMGGQNYIKSIATLYDLDSDDTIENTSFAKEDTNAPGMSPSQMSGCSISYSRKYNLGGLFLFDDGVDADSNYSKNYSPNVQSPSEATKTSDRTDYSNMTKEQKILNIKIQINDCSTIDELSALFKKIGKWSENAEIRNFFTKRKNEIIQGQDPAF